MSWKLKYCYNFSFTERPIRDLASRGFSVEQAKDEDEQGLKRGVVRFATGELQILDIIDEEAFQKHEKEMNHRYRSAHDILRPGLVLSHSRNETLSAETFSGFSVFSEENQAVTSNTEHANSCYKIEGVYLNVSDEELLTAANKFGRTVKDHQFSFADGFRFIQAQEDDEFCALFRRKKDFPFWAVILKCQDFEKFVKLAQPDNISVWRGQKIAQIEEYMTCWDLLIIE